MTNPSLLNRNVQLAFGAAITILLVVGVFSYRALVLSNESDRWVEHTHEVLENFQGLLFAMAGIESSNRGFVLTGDKSDLQSYRASTVSAEQRNAALRSLTVDNPEQRRRLRILDDLIAQKVQFSEMVISLRQTKGLEAGADAIRTGVGQRITDQFQAEVRQLEDDELRLLAQRNAGAEQDLNQAKTVLILGTMLGLMTATGAGWSVQRDASRRRVAENALENSHDQFRMLGVKYRALMEAAPDAMVVVNQDGDVVLLNLQAEKQFGYRRDELLGQQVTNIIPEGFAERLIADGTRSAAEALAQHIGTGIELTARRKDGREFPIELMLSPLENAEGILVTAAIRDISVRKAAENHLAQMEGKYRGLLEAAPDAIVVVNEAGKIVLLNARAEKQFGYRRDELLGQKVKNIIPKGFAERLIADGTRTAAEALAQQIGMGIELIARRKDGSEFPIELMLSPLDTAEGILVTAAIRDVTARKEAQKALGESEERFRMAVEAAEMGTWFYDVQHDEVSWSKKFGTLFGLTSDAKLTYQEITQSIHPDDRSEIDQAVKSTLKLGVPYNIEYRVIWPDSSVHWMAAKGRSHRNPEGQPVHMHMQGVVMDITERKEAQEASKHREAMERRSAELTRSNDDLQQFAYIAAHDLQEPLRMVASYTQLLAKRYKGRLDSDADEFIAYAVDGAHRMQLLIGDLLAYCRVGTTGKSPRETPSETALEKAVLNLKSAIHESGGVVTHDPLPMVMADGAQLIQLFQNVIGNAIKYRSAESPRVHVSARKHSTDGWIFSVRDNGLGIDPQFFEKIFVMFQRLHGREEFSGTGIGLALCKKIAERHGGRMWVESVAGRGSTFYLALPERG